LDEAPPPAEQDGEDLPNDEEARKFAKLVARDLERNNGSHRIEVFVFDAKGKPLP
jgi:hypothetical protein